MKVQEWLEKNYPNRETRVIYLNQQLEGILDCREYKRLEKILISSLVDSSKLEIKKNSYKEGYREKIKETKIIPCLLAQTWLDRAYPKNGTCIRKGKWDKVVHHKEENHQDFGKTRAEIKELDISHKGLEGILDLSDFKNCEELDCQDNCLTNLKVNNCWKLKRIDCSNNQLTTLNVSNLAELETLECSDNYLTQIPAFPQPEKITVLNVSNNNINPSNLTIFSQFKNLKRLWIGNTNINKINHNIYNHFTGSCEPCKDLNKLESLSISNTDLDSGWEYLPDSLEHFYYNTTLRPNCKLAQNKAELEKEIWADIHQKFSPKYEKDWLAAGFSKGQTKKILKEWGQFEIKPEEGTFINWFLNFKKLDLTWALENEEEFEDLRDRYSSFGTCQECQQPNTSESWCQSCNARHFQAEFFNWTSGNPQIDKFIQKCQLEATSPWNVLEWIPHEKFDKKIELQIKLQTINSELQSLNSEYKNLKSKSKIEQLINRSKKKEIKQKISEHSLQLERLTNKIEEGQGKVELIAKGGFSKVEKAEWKEGSIERWDNKKKEWKRSYYKIVALKTLSNSQNLNQDFLQELILYKMFRSSVSQMVPCYGISRDREGNYIMVMEYMREGNLREFLRRNYRELKFYNNEKPWEISKFNFLKQIIQGLKDIHRKKLIHCDFHSGNIVVDYSRCRITDLGLSQPVNEVQTKNTIYGLMPYMAPEVLKGEPYTPKADIYSLGIIMYELITGLPPYAERAHDTNLALMILQGQRPQFPKLVKYPQLLVDLIKQCWEPEPDNRPTAREISGIVGEWFDEYGRLKTDNELYQQLQDTEDFNNTLPDEIKYLNHQSLEKIWHSRPINTQQITQQLATLNISRQLGQDSKQIELVIPDTITEIEEVQEESSTRAQIQIPPKQ